MSLLAITLFTLAQAQPPLAEIEAPEARQGVAVDAHHVYAIGNRVIAKYDKFTGERAAIWNASDEEPLIHLNSGIVRDGKLICAHSNHSDLPMTSSVEIWDAETLQHIDSHSFGILYGSLTWIDRHDAHWWAGFAHYDGNGGYPGKDHTYTSVVKFDDNWQRVASWVFPQEILDRFKPHSTAGGAWGPDGLLYCTGHDRPEMYAFALPKAGSILRHIRTIPFPIEGQAIAFDTSGTNLVYGIVRREGKIVAAPLPRTDDQAAIDRILDEAFPDPEAPGAVAMAMRNGEVVYIGARGTANLETGQPLTPETPIRIASVSKQFTAMAILILEERGKLRFDDPVSQYLPDFPSYGVAVNIRHLLNHTAGLPGYEGDVPNDFEGFLTDRGVYKILQQKDALTDPPGERYRYSNAGYALLAVLVEEISGKPFQDFMKENVFLPLGMSSSSLPGAAFESIPERAIGYRRKRDGYVWLDHTPTALVMGDGGIYTTIRDFTKWEKGLRNYALISANTLAEAYTPATLNNGEQTAYGFGWEVATENGILHVGHPGNSAGFAADYRRIPEKGLAAAVFMNQQSFTGAVKLTEQIIKVLQAD